MISLFKHLLLICFLFVGKASAQFSPSVLLLSKLTKDSIHLRPYAWIYADKSRALTFQQIQNQFFTPLSNFGFDSKFQYGRYYYWLQFSVENTTSDTLKMSLNVNPAFDSVLVFSTENGQLTEPPLVIGSLIEQHPQSDSRAFPSNRSALLSFAPHATKTIYVRCQALNFDRFIDPVLFYPETELGFYIRDLITFFVWNGSFLSILGFVLITSLLSYRQTRHRAFLYYAAYILAHIAFFGRDLDSNNPFYSILPVWFRDYYYRTPISWSWGIFYLLFLSNFLETKRKQPQMHKFFLFSLVVYAVLTLIDRILISYDYWLAWEATVWARFFLTFMGLVQIVFILWKLKNNPLACYILVGSLCYAFGALATRFDTQVLEFLGLKRNIFWDNGLIFNQIGIILELIFFSMGLAYKFRLDHLEKERLEIKTQQLSLEKELGLAQLRNQIAQDIHDEIGAGLTKVSLTAQVSAMFKDLSVNELREKLTRIGADTRQLAAQTREIVFTINPDYDSFEEMQAYFMETARDFWANTPIELCLDFETNAGNPSVSPIVKRQLLHIFKEAQNNIAKYAEATTVHIRFNLTSKQHYLLEICDNGKGFSTDCMSKCTRGIVGMRQRAESANAIFQIDSQKDFGTKIRVEGSL